MLIYVLLSVLNMLLFLCVCNFDLLVLWPCSFRKAGFLLHSSDLIHNLFSTLSSSTNMTADVIIHAHASPEYFVQREGINKEFAREKCTEMETQPKETLTELSSAQLIIEILQKGSNMSITSDLVSNNISTTPHEEVYHEVNNNLNLVTTRQSSDPKKLMEHVTVPNSQTFATSYWYSILAGLRETEVVTSQPHNGTRNI